MNELYHSKCFNELWRHSLSSTKSSSQFRLNDDIALLIKSVIYWLHVLVLSHLFIVFPQIRSNDSQVYTILDLILIFVVEDLIIKKDEFESCNLNFQFLSEDFQ